ncbi:MAG: hypothetical protein AAB910_02780 [Patescibacteria group bacterium]
MTKVRILKKKSYLAMIRNAAKGENHIFRNLWASVDGEVRDINKNGELACGFFASAILYLNKLIGDMHAGVAGLERDLSASGWMQMPELRDGAVIIWKPRPSADETPHLHAGFYVGDDRAVSNGSNSTLMPEEHHITYDGTRSIVRIWWHPALDES